MAHPSRALIVFDLDGTLIDSRRDIADTVNDILASYSAPPLEVEAVTRMIGEGARVLVERALAASHIHPKIEEALDRFREIYDRRLLNHTRPYEGIVEVVQRAQATATLAVLTNKPEAPTRRILDAFDLSGAFVSVIGGDSGFTRKPDPAGLMHLVETAGSRAALTLMIGDSEVDRGTATAADTAFCAAHYGFGRVGEATLSAATPAQLGSVIQTFVDTHAAARV